MSATGLELPQLGAAIRDEWLLDWSNLTVNHGSYGATPRVVLAAQDAWRKRMEQQPTFFMKDVLPGALRAAADRLGRLLGADGADIAFVDNATTGANALGNEGFDIDNIFEPVELNGQLRRLRVANDVGDQFLHDTVDLKFHGAGQPLVPEAVGRQFHFDNARAAQGLRQRVELGFQAKFGQHEAGHFV